MPLRYPTTNKEFTTPIAAYKGFEYWVEGKHSTKTTKGCYTWLILHPDGTVEQSEVSSETVFGASAAARARIDELAPVPVEAIEKLEPIATPEPTPKKRRGRPPKVKEPV